MPDLLLELFSEEIPARMQAQAAKDLERLVVGALSDRGLLFEGVKAFSGPRRLTLSLLGLPAKQPDVTEEKKGPRVDAPEKALHGFLRSAGVTLEQCQKQSDAKGEFYVAVIARKGRATAEVLSEILPEAFAKLPWPKSMRWPQDSGGWGEGGWGEGSFGGVERWVRPLRSILCMFDGEVVPFSFAGVESGNTTRGHRFLSDGKPISARHFEDYEKALRDAHVILDAEERKEIIVHEAKQKAFALGLEPIEDAGLLEEVAGLAEWPVVLIGAIEDQFMDVPPEILQTSMRVHQKYFALRGADGTMASRFAVVANMIAADGGKEIVAGNERVLRARLSDAKFFWDQDRKTKLADRVEALKGIVFHAKLGTQYERVERIEALAGEIAAKIGAGLAEGERNKLVEKAKRAARLCKADLTSGVVGEFPELQGVMGRYYALHDSEDAEVADAVRDHYRPQGPSDSVTTARVSIAVALAEKLDALAGFFLVSERPTGSGDPFALRRAALGAVRLILDNKLNIPLVDILGGAIGGVSSRQGAKAAIAEVVENRTAIHGVFGEGLLARFAKFFAPSNNEISDKVFEDSWPQIEDAMLALLAFFAERLKVALREKGARYDLIDAVFSLGTEDDLVRLVSRVEALQAFLKTDDGANLLAGYKRAANILKIERKKEKNEAAFSAAPERELFELPEEENLHAALLVAKGGAAEALAREDFAAAMSALALLRGPVDRFFEAVKVNDENPKLRENRLKLLAQIVETAHTVADFSKIEG